MKKYIIRVGQPKVSLIIVKLVFLLSSSKTNNLTFTSYLAVKELQNWKTNVMLMKKKNKIQLMELQILLAELRDLLNSYKNVKNLIQGELS